MKKLVLAIGLVLSTSFFSNSQKNDTNSVEFEVLENQFKQIIKENGFFGPEEYKDHTHLRNNMMQILLSDNNSELFKSIDEQKKVFGSITYFKMLNGSIINANSVVPYDEPNVTVYNTTTLYEIINDLKLNYPEIKSFEPDDIKTSEYFEDNDNLIWKFKNDKVEYSLEILFNHTQIKEITFISNNIQ